MKVLIAVDGSNYGEKILHEVGSYEWPEKTEFKLLMVTAPCNLWESAKQFQETCRIILDTRVHIFQKKMPNYKVSSLVLEGEAAKTIVDTAAEWHANWIVIGSQGESGPHKKGIGSVAADVMSNASCSVQLIKVKNGIKNGQEKNLLHKEHVH
ncbi:MAG: universal stress protein [Candidatus Obscuribacterales bacterium]|nr:universal stress protein [Candidatus Obscuribacterales bacterium]